MEVFIASFIGISWLGLLRFTFTLSARRRNNWRKLASSVGQEAGVVEELLPARPMT
jgi:hypothetical protein